MALQRHSGCDVCRWHHYIWRYRGTVAVMCVGGITIYVVTVAVLCVGGITIYGVTVAVMCVGGITIDGVTEAQWL